MKPANPLSEPHSPLAGRRLLLEGLAVALIATLLVLTPSVTGLGKVGAGETRLSALDRIAEAEVQRLGSGPPERR